MSSFTAHEELTGSTHTPNLQAAAMSATPAKIDVKTKTVFPGEVELDGGAKGPVPDDYLYDFKYNHPLPTSSRLGTTVAEDADAEVIAASLLDKLSSALGDGDANRFADLFVDFGEHSSHYYLAAVLRHVTVCAPHAIR